MSPSIPGPAALLSVAGRGVDSIERAVALIPRMADAITTAELLLVRMDTVLSTIEQFQPTLQELQPILDRIVRTTDPDEVAAVVEMVNLTPELVTKLRSDIIPVIDTLGTVAPDVRDLLDVSKELNGMLAGLPGLGRLKRKVDEEQADSDAYRADEEPPAAPDRGADAG